MKHIHTYLFLLLIVLLASCVGIKPKNFTYYFEDKYTGIDTLIDIQGYYIAQRACDTTFYSIFMFYANGLLSIATGSDMTELSECFAGENQSTLCRYPLWGTYRIKGDTILTQTILEEGIGICVIFRDYLITPEKKLLNISDYIIPEYTNLGNMKQYPSFHDNPCLREIDFYPLATKRDSLECPLLKRSYFRGK